MKDRIASLADFAHELRQRPTASEARLWQALRASQLGVAFRRQVVLVGLIVDSFAPAAVLVVEVDGGYHVRRRGADARRDLRLRGAGVRVVRVEAEAVHRDLGAVVQRIREAL